jgi:hypothetical protein
MIPVRVPILLALAASAALPAAAHAATWAQQPGRCYVSVGAADDQRQAVPIEVDGFAPSSTVDVVVDGVDVADVIADSRGHVSGAVRAPYQASGRRPFAITVSERGNPANAVTASPLVTALEVTLKPALAAPSTRVRFRGAGFTARRPVWAHYVFHGKLRRTVRLARPHGACGRFAARRRQIPLTRPHTGRWTVQFDQQKAYAPVPSTVFVRYTIDVRPRAT